MSSKSLKATVFMRPNGRQEETIIKDISEDDANFFITRSVKISMEDSPGFGPTVYADYGAVTEDGEPDEIIVFSCGRSCEATMAELRQIVERAMAAQPSRGI